MRWQNAKSCFYLSTCQKEIEKSCKQVQQPQNKFFLSHSNKTTIKYSFLRLFIPVCYYIRDLLFVLFPTQSLSLTDYQYWCVNNALGGNICKLTGHILKHKYSNRRKDKDYSDAIHKVYVYILQAEFYYDLVFLLHFILY